MLLFSPTTFYNPEYLFLRFFDLLRYGVSIGSCEIGDVGFSQLVQGIASNPSSTLKVLYTDHNNVGAIGGKALGEVLSEMKIATLYIDSNNFGDDGIVAIAAGLAGNEVLEIIDLDSTGFGEAGATALAAAISTNDQLTWLDINENKLGTCSFVVIACLECHLYIYRDALAVLLLFSTLSASQHVLIDIRNLCMYCDATYNTNPLLGPEAVEPLLKVLASNTVMTSLGIGGNKLGEEGAEAVAEMIGRNTALKSMSIGNNNIGDAGVEALEDALGRYIIYTYTRICIFKCVYSMEYICIICIGVGKCLCIYSMEYIC